MATRNDRIAAAFARTAESGRAAALIPYIAAGDPSPAATVPLMHALVEAGADVIELGVPFSDPMADGPVIQRAADRAIAQGVGLARVLEMVAEFRQRDADTPVVLMGYANPIERMGQDRFAQDAARAGVDGVLAQVARGYVYYVSLKGVTGAGSLNTDDVAERVALIRRHVRDIPVGVGFGIRDAESAQRVARAADAVVIGSKLIETMEQAAADAPAAQKNDAAVAAASGWLRTIRQALDQVKRANASA